MISGGSCDTEDWNNSSFAICRFLLFYCIFWSNKCSLGKHKRLKNI